MSDSETSVKYSKGRGCKSGSTGLGGTLEKLDLIRVILSMKKFANESASNLKDVLSGRTETGFLWSMLLNSFQSFLGLFLMLLIVSV